MNKSLKRDKSPTLQSSMDKSPEQIFKGQISMNKFSKKRVKSPKHKSSKKINLLSKSGSQSLRSNMNFCLL